MRDQPLAILCDPATREPLEITRASGPGGPTDSFLVNARTGRRYPIRGGIPVLLEQAERGSPNAKYQCFYNRIAPVYDFSEQLYALFKRRGAREMRRGYLDELEITNGARVLEVSVGTGINIPLLPATVEFYGLDLSWGMLSRCRRNLKRWGRDVCLFQGEAESLPFRDASFDVVFHFGGINFFSDKRRAIAEMIRVARAGTRIVISDETEKHVKDVYEKTPLAGRFFRHRAEAVSAPVELVPRDMQEVRTKEFRGGSLYCLSFRKPAASQAEPAGDAL